MQTQGNSSTHSSSPLLLTAIVLAMNLPACGLAGTTGFDVRFGDHGILLLGPTSTGRTLGLTTVLPLASGKFLVAGVSYNDSDPGFGAILPAVGLLNSEGIWDTAFADHGLFILPFGSSSAPQGGIVNHLALFSNGGILATGGTRVTFGLPDNRTCSLLVKLTEGGAPDTSFAADHNGTFCFDFAPDTSDWHSKGHWEGVQIDSDDSFFLTSPITNLGSGAVAHFDSTGELVSSWGTNGIATMTPYLTLLELQSGHELVASGLRGFGIGVQTIANVKLDAGGALDDGYGTHGEFDFAIENESSVSPMSSERDATGNLLVAGYGAAHPFLIARSTAAGGPDPSFNGGGQQPGGPGWAALDIDSGSSLAGLWQAHVLPDGHLFAVGEVGVSYINGALIRLNSDASYDTSYGDAAHPGWAQLNIGGTASSSTYVRALAADAEGRVLVTLTLTDANGHFCSGLVRIVPDRLSDSGFEPAAAMPNCPQ